MIIKRIEELHTKNEHEKIIELIACVDERAVNYELTCLYARALNYTAKYEEALKRLLSVKEEGCKDQLWFLRLGYSYYYLGKPQKAIACFEKSLQLSNANREEALLFIALCLHELKEMERFEVICEELKNKNYETWEKFFCPKQYSEEKRNKVIQYIEKNFGKIDSIIECEELDIKIDICVILPKKNQDFITLVSLGMGNITMCDGTVDICSKAELVLYLPKDWDMNKLDQESHWPIEYLRKLARLPFIENTCLGNGHLVLNGKPFTPNTKMNSFILMDAIYEGSSECCMIEDNEALSFYLLFPLYPEESDYREIMGMKGLINLLENTSLVLDTQRPNYALKNDRYLEIKKQMNRLLKS